MLELPRHHVSRRALRERLDGASVIVIEGPSGFGKTTLATELTAGDDVLEIALTALRGHRREFFRLLRRELLQAGELTAGSALSDSTADTGQLLEAVHDALRDADQRTLLIEDAHHLGDDGALIVEFARQRPASLRLIVTARSLPTAAAGLRSLPGAEIVTDDDLRFDRGEADTLLRIRFGIDLDDADLTSLLDRTAGWPAGLALTGVHLRRRPPASRTLESADLRMRFADAVLAVLPPQLRPDIEQLAHLEFFDADVAEALAGRPGFLDEVLALGIPLVKSDDGHVRFPGSLADALREREPLNRAIAHRVALVHLTQARPTAAFEVLRLIDDDHAVATFLLDMPPQARRQLSADEIIGIISTLSTDAIARHPGVLVELARAAARTGVPAAHMEALDRASAAEPMTPELSRAIDVERMTYELYTRYMTDRVGESRRIRELVSACGPGEERTLGRALAVQGQQHAWDGHHGQADHLLRRAAVTLSAAGEDWTASGALVQLGFNVHLHAQLAVAEETFAEAVQLAGNDGRARATALTYLGEVKIWRGRVDEGVPDLAEAEQLARAVRDSRAHAYAAWGLALHASVTGDVERTIARTEQAGRLLSDWMDTGVGATYLATMTDLLDRVGGEAVAARMRQEMLRRRDEAPELTTIAEFGVAARRGDPAHAEALWPQIEADSGIEPFERVRCRLLRVYAALRADSDEATSRYRELVADAESLGGDGIPWHLEPDAATHVRHWWTQQRSGWRIRLLGPFELRQGDDVVVVPAGRPRELIWLLGLRPGPQRIDTVIDRLWGVDADERARARLRQLLYRLRQVAPGLIVRTETTLGLDPGVVVDLHEFDRLAERVRRDPTATESARRMIALVNEAFFALDTPETLEEQVESLRSRVQVSLTAAHDALAHALDDSAAIDHLERAHALDPADVQRTERLVTLLLEADRPAQAHFVLDTTTQALEELGVLPLPTLERLARRRT